ncbi:MAG TPA: Holliday junction resolvase RuvX [Caldimonas sp.]|nr:Holliday junction resolvase RuvX [Caldimonas sp.]
MNDAILAVDLGEARIGVAVAERFDLPALPLTTIQHTNREADIAAITALAVERSAGTLVVGYPLKLDGTRGPAAERVDRFVEALRDRFQGEVALVDERLTTAAATKRLAASGVKGSKQRRVVDRVAAVEILESYLARRRA